MSSFNETVILCRKCGYVRIFFNENQRGHNGNLIPLCYKTKEIHYCEVSESFECLHCQALIYLDRRVLDSNSRRIPLNYDTEDVGKYHSCSKKKTE